MKTNRSQFRLFLMLSIWSCMVSCRKDSPSANPPVEKLLQKVYKDGVLYLDIFYDDKYIIHRIDYYRNGEKFRQSNISLNESGRVKEVVSNFDHYTAIRALTYDGERKVLDETTSDFDDGRSSYFKRIWKYPAKNVIEDHVYFTEDSEDASYVYTFMFTETGNLERKEQKVASLPIQDSYEIYQYDTGLSYEHMIESNIPGYFESPVSKNQPLNAKVYKKSGELVSEIRYRNTYDKDGYLEVSLQQSDEWQEEYRFRYSLKDSKNN